MDRLINTDTRCSPVQKHYSTWQVTLWCLMGVSFWSDYVSIRFRVKAVRGIDNIPVNFCINIVLSGYLPKYLMQTCQLYVAVITKLHNMAVF